MITIENLTTFHSFSDADALIIYLGGYHNTIRRRFIQRIFEQNKGKRYYHYGDIDAGGFYILQHLRRKTGIPFEPLRMDVKTLAQNEKEWKKLMENDRNRLQNLMIESEFSKQLHDISGRNLLKYANSQGERCAEPVQK